MGRRRASDCVGRRLGLGPAPGGSSPDGSVRNLLGGADESRQRSATVRPWRARSGTRGTGVCTWYTVLGEGPVDLVYTNGIWSNLDVMWDEPRWARYLDRRWPRSAG